MKKEIKEEGKKDLIQQHLIWQGFWKTEENHSWMLLSA